MSKRTISVYPSILACDFGHLADEAQRLQEAGADGIHVDIMDGQFVPNLSMGPQIVSALNRATSLPLDVHLMMYNPYDYIERFVAAGADSITFHFEATEDVEETLKYIRACGVKAGLAFCPETSMSMALNYLDKCDLLLLMTVHPGFGGQKFMPEVLDKVRFVRDICDKLHIREGGRVDETNKLPPFVIQVDGGINVETANEAIAAGATNIVAGTYVFKALDMKLAIASLRGS